MNLSTIAIISINTLIITSFFALIILCIWGKFNPYNIRVVDWALRWGFTTIVPIGTLSIIGRFHVFFEENLHFLLLWTSFSILNYFIILLILNNSGWPDDPREKPFSFLKYLEFIYFGVIFTIYFISSFIACPLVTNEQCFSTR